MRGYLPLLVAKILFNTGNMHDLLPYETRRR